MRTVSEHSQAQSAYEPTLWAKVFHSVPHVNITFHSVNSQFNPENDLYLESLGILASIPAAWLITTLVRSLINSRCSGLWKVWLFYAINTKYYPTKQPSFCWSFMIELGFLRRLTTKAFILTTKRAIFDAVTRLVH